MWKLFSIQDDLAAYKFIDSIDVVCNLKRFDISRLNTQAVARIAVPICRQIALCMAISMSTLMLLVNCMIYV